MEPPFEGMVLFEVTLAGGPFSGDKNLEWGWPERGPSTSGLMRVHGSFSEAMQTWYASARFDEETWRFVRPHVSTRPVEYVEGSDLTEKP